ncbi:hypothetical protein [Methylobacterium sp. J-067]|uniref:hypothetical protein n=1 Tax=Methylobacterium sp. J-067 TaxID=2836648 RepID=UPI001FB9B94A|nr:hypothetical protein [Methylobacterium sp. J-067]MCJ2026923.1 hypothetical protein [Methylobacterium sp. J-067]
MADACPVLSPEQMRDEVLSAGLDPAPPPKADFVSVVHQRTDLTLCGATVGTFEGGDARKAIGLIRNQQMIAHRYRGADIAVTPKAQEELPGCSAGATPPVDGQP